MGLIDSENLAGVRVRRAGRRSIIRLKNIRDYLSDIIESVQDEDDPDYGELSCNVANVRLSLEQAEYSFKEIAKFLESLSDEVNTITEETQQ